MGPHGGRAEPWAPTYFGIHVEGRRTQMWNELTFVDDRGRVRWNYRWQDEPYSELLKSVEAGALPGDPSRLYFIRAGGMGDGVVSSFPEFFHLSHIWWDVLKAAYDAGGVLLTAKTLLDWAESGERATEVGEEKAKDWEASGGQPYKVQELVRRSTGWDPAQFAALMGISEGDAKALLASFGGEESDDGRWRIGDDEFSKLMAESMFLILASPHIDHDAFRGEIKKRLDAFLATGNAPEVDWEEFGKLPLDPHWSANRVEADDADWEAVPEQSWRRRVRFWFRRRGLG